MSNLRRREPDSWEYALSEHGSADTDRGKESFDDAGATVAHRASRAFGWSFGNTVAARLGTLAIGIALARVLGPEEFGIFAIATVALLAVLSFNELGVSLAVIRWRDDPRTVAPTINTIS